MKLLLVSRSLRTALKMGVPHSGQRCRVSHAEVARSRSGGAASIWHRSGCQKPTIEKAAPVQRRHIEQWQYAAIMGGPASVKRTRPQ